MGQNGINFFITISSQKIKTEEKNFCLIKLFKQLYLILLLGIRNYIVTFFIFEFDGRIYLFLIEI